MRILPAFLAAVLLAPTASADWLMTGHDAQQTGRVEAGAPAWDDVALQVRIPRLGSDIMSEPVALGGSVFVAHYRPLYFASQLTTSSAYTMTRIDLGSGNLTSYASPLQSDGTSCFTPELASDGRRVFLLVGGYVTAFDPLNATFEEPIPLGIQPGAGPYVGDAARADRLVGLCSLIRDRMVFSEGRLYVASGARPAGTYRALRLYVVDPQNGTVRGPWVNAGPKALEWVSTPSQTDDAGQLSGAEQQFFELAGLAVSQGKAVVTAHLVSRAFESTQDDAGITTRRLAQAWSVDTNTGREWAYGGLTGSMDRAGSVVSPPLIAGDTAYFKEPFRTFAINLSSGAPAGLHQVPNDGADRGSGMAWAAGRLFVARGHTLSALDSNFQALWPAALEIESIWQPGGLVVAGDSVIGVASSGRGSPSVVYVVEARSGRVQWTHPLAAEARIIADDGLVVAIDYRGTLTVLGEASNSLRPAPAVSSLYPRPGEEVVVGMGGTPPSPLGAATEFRADWGDGEVGDWSSVPDLRHVYATAIESRARFYARNAAGQTASVPITFHVGQHDPAINILNAPFDDEYQQTTFFLLGLLATGVIAFFGILRAGRKRRRFHRLLRALEHDGKRLAADPKGCDAMLNERRSAARAAFLEKRIEEAHASFLERRVDELRRGLRLGTIEEKLKFLPYGMVAQLQRLLQDARVDEWERQHFVEALQAQGDLSPAQKTKARRVIDEWFVRDAEVTT
ncbi:MAG: hypothetical protein HYT80_01000 [Euryarchaeota archaeon]|nr:hypothetical protein [Euryarchaeota archaeon]